MLKRLFYKYEWEILLVCAWLVVMGWIASLELLI